MEIEMENYCEWRESFQAEDTDNLFFTAKDLNTVWLNNQPVEFYDEIAVHLVPRDRVPPAVRAQLPATTVACLVVDGYVTPISEWDELYEVQKGWDE